MMSSALRDAVGLAAVGRSQGRGAPGRRRFETREAGQPRLGLRAAAGRALVADLAARAGGRARERRDRGRVVVGLDLHQDVHRLDVRAVDAGRRIGEEAPAPRSPRSPRRCPCRPTARPPGSPRCCGGSSGTATAAARSPSIDEVGVEDLVAAVLAVRLREHHQLDVGRIAPQRPVGVARGSRSRRARAPAPARRWRAPARARPSRPSATRPSGRGGGRSNRRAASLGRSSTDSVIRSCSARTNAASSTISPATT